MKDIREDLKMLTPQKNTKNLACFGCRKIYVELYSLNIDGKIILMCPACRESIQAIIDKEDYHDTVSIVQQQFKEGIAVNKNNSESSGCAEFGILDKGRYFIDHQDC